MSEQEKDGEQNDKGNSGTSSSIKKTGKFQEDVRTVDGSDDNSGSGGSNGSSNNNESNGRSNEDLNADDIVVDENESNGRSNEDLNADDVVVDENESNGRSNEDLNADDVIVDENESNGRSNEDLNADDVVVDENESNGSSNEDLNADDVVVTDEHESNGRSNEDLNADDFIVDENESNGSSNEDLNADDVVVDENDMQKREDRFNRQVDKNDMKNQAEEAKDQLDDLQEVHHTTENGVEYTTGQDGIIVQYSPEMEVSDNILPRVTHIKLGDVDMYSYDGQKKFSSEEACKEALKQDMQQVVVNNEIYNDMQKRQAAGEILTTVEQDFIKEHEETLKRYHLQNKDNELVSTQRGVAYRQYDGRGYSR